MSKLFKSQITFTLGTENQTKELRVHVLHAEGDLDSVVQRSWREVFSFITLIKNVELKYSIDYQNRITPSSHYVMAARETAENNFGTLTNTVTELQGFLGEKLEALSGILGYSASHFGVIPQRSGFLLWGGNIDETCCSMGEITLHPRMEFGGGVEYSQTRLDLFPQRGGTNIVSFSATPFSSARALWGAYFEYLTGHDFTLPLVIAKFIGIVNAQNKAYLRLLVEAPQKAEEVLQKYCVLDIPTMREMKAGDLREELQFWGFAATNKKVNLAKLDAYEAQISAAKAAIQESKLSKDHDCFVSFLEALELREKSLEEFITEPLHDFYNTQKAYMKHEAQKAK